MCILKIESLTKNCVCIVTKKSYKEGVKMEEKTIGRIQLILGIVLFVGIIALSSIFSTNYCKEGNRAEKTVEKATETTYLTCVEGEESHIEVYKTKVFDNELLNFGASLEIRPVPHIFRK